MSAMSTQVEVKESPIIFSGPMVRAILDGRKTQTRRVIVFRDGGKPFHFDNNEPLHSWNFDAATGKFYLGASTFNCPYGRRGDRLWVRETWATGFNAKFHDEHGLSAPDYLVDPTTRESLIVYAADRQFPMLINEEFMAEHDHVAWRPSIHMRRTASRITLEITNVRVERLQDVSQTDCIAEGIPPLPRRDWIVITDFHKQWDSINAKREYSWESNPWVWVIEFRRLNANNT
jgi:hypothetical protein